MDKKETPSTMKATLEFNGEEFVVQHPGNRAWLRIYQTLLSDAKNMDIERFMDWCFEHVVHPKKGGKLVLDTIHVAEMMEWVALLQSFLSRGELDPDHAWRDYKGTGLAIGKREDEGGDSIPSGSEPGVDNVAPDNEGSG